MFPFERVFKVVGEPNFKLPGEEQGEFIENITDLLNWLDIRHQNAGISKLKKIEDGGVEFIFTIYNQYGVNPATYEITFDYYPKTKDLRIYSLLSERQSALVVRFIIEHYLRIGFKEKTTDDNLCFVDLCRKLSDELIMRSRMCRGSLSPQYTLKSRQFRAYATLGWLNKTWVREVRPAFDELVEILSGKRQIESYEAATLLQANRPKGEVKYNPIIKYLKPKSAIEIFEAKMRLLPTHYDTIVDILKQYEEQWKRLLPLCVKTFKSAGMKLQARYMECARTAGQITASYTGTTSDESREKAKRAFTALCEALDALAAAEVDGDCIAKYYGRVPKEDDGRLKVVLDGVTKNGAKSLREAMKNKGGKKYDKSLTKDWTQKKAAALLGISERRLRAYKTNPPDAHWPGWEDPVALKQWMNQREDRDLMAQAMSRHLPYRETVTERSMKK